MKPPVKPGVETRGPAVFLDGVEERDEYFLATGVHARRVAADLAELRALDGSITDWLFDGTMGPSM